MGQTFINLSDPAWLGFLAAFGLCYSLFGYMITRVVVMVLALFWGFQQGGLISEYYLQIDSITVRFVISIFTALILAFSSLFAFWLLAFAVGCYLGYQLGLLVFGSSLVSVLLISLAVGVAFAALERWLVIGLSSFVGAWLLVISVALLVGAIVIPASSAQTPISIETLLQLQLNSPIVYRIAMVSVFTILGFFVFIVQMYLDSSQELKWLR